MINPKLDSINHKIQMSNRAEGSVTGVIDVVSFDLEEILVDTDAGRLKIRGDKLHVKSINLEKKLMEFEGNVNDMGYVDSKAMKRKSLMGRLFG